ncbi:hypothetical protein ACL02S_15320 [Nocardia sp. 004]|uniref:hypothetical protein n=1 Tax=Nocardia sp. 004 TaxID=3385978 RepID=UPI0039A34C08
MVYAVVTTIVAALLAGSAAAMVWDPLRRDRPGELDLEPEQGGVAPQGSPERRGVEWPRKEMR